MGHSLKVKLKQLKANNIVQFPNGIDKQISYEFPSMILLRAIFIESTEIDIS
jgi:hypothetical protein